MEKEKKEVKKFSVTFTTEGTESKHKFSPKVTAENFQYHYKNLMDNFIGAIMELFNDFSILRPATTEELEKHIYVFKTDDKEDAEHRIYSIRKVLYENTLKVFNYTLTTLFPDIQYIEECNNYQQEFAFADKTEDEIENYKYDVEALTQEIRDNYDQLIVALNAAMVKEQKEKEETK